MTSALEIRNVCENLPSRGALSLESIYNCPYNQSTFFVDSTLQLCCSIMLDMLHMQLYFNFLVILMNVLYNQGSSEQEGVTAKLVL